jgi:hypothetical protein
LKLKRLESLLLEGFDLAGNPRKVLWTLLSVLGLGEAKAIAADGKPGKEEGESRSLKEAFLSLLAVLIHRLSDHSKVDAVSLSLLLLH